MSEENCQSCGSVASQVSQIEYASGMCVQLHETIARLYDNLLSQLTDEEDKEAIVKARDLQLELAQKSQFMTVPELLGEEAK